MISPSKFGRRVASLARLLEKSEALFTKINATAAPRPVTRWQRRQVIRLQREYLKLDNRILRAAQKMASTQKLAAL